MLRDMRADYKPATRRRPHHRGHQWAVAGISVMAIVLLTALSGMSSSTNHSIQIVEMVLALPAVDDDTAIPAIVPSEADDGELVTVRAGDSLARIFDRIGFSAREVHAVVNASADARRLTNLRPNETLSILRADDGGLAQLDYPLDDAHTLRI